MLTTHYLDEAERLSDRVAIIADGRILTVGPARTIAERSGAPTRISFATPLAVTRGECRPPAELGASINGEEVIVLTGAASETMQSILGWARRCHLDPLANLAVVPPDLEDAYLRIVDANPTSSR